MAGLGGEHHLVDDNLRFLRMLLEIVAQSLADGLLHYSHHLVVAEFGLGLTLKLGLGHLHRNDSRQTVAEILFRELDLEFLEHLVVVGIFLEGCGQTAAEAGEVGSALDCVDVVDE